MKIVISPNLVGRWVTYVDGLRVRKTEDTLGEAFFFNETSKDDEILVTFPAVRAALSMEVKITRRYDGIQPMFDLHIDGEIHSSYELIEEALESLDELLET